MDSGENKKKKKNAEVKIITVNSRFTQQRGNHGTLNHN